MDDAMIAFDNEEFGSLRVADMDGETWFCARDIAEALGYSNPSKAVADHCRGITIRYPLATPGGNQEFVFITEPDVFRLIVSSKLPSAQKFESWVFEEVLPSLRKTGGYMIAKRDETPEETIARALLMAKDVIDRKDKVIEAQSSQIEEMAPKALFADAVAASDTSILVGELAKLLRQNGIDIGRNRLFGWLRDGGWLMKGGESYNLPTQRAMDAGLFEVKERVVKNPDGSVRITRTTKVTGKGQQYFINAFLAERAA